MKLEDANNLPTDAITSTKFIKPLHFRYKEQKVAHLIVGFSSCEEANTIIQQGLYIEGKHVIVRKSTNRTLQMSEMPDVWALHIRMQGPE